MVVSNPTLIVLNPHSPMSLSYIYLFNTERSSSSVRINDLANGLECAIFQKILIGHDKGEKFSGQTGPRDFESNEMCNFY